LAEATIRLDHQPMARVAGVHTEKNQTNNDEVEFYEMSFLVPRACWQNSGEIIADGGSCACVFFAHVVVEVEERKNRK